MMRERSEGIGGRFSVESGRGRGTEVEVLVPLSPVGAA
jgi:signal transduction histidine kinase